jgi:predicted MFS family arabinose efflux permease
MDYMIIMPLGARLMDTLAISASQFANLVGAYSLAAAGAGLLAGFVVDRFDRRTILLYLYAGFTLATFACAFAHTYGILLVARFAAGAFGGVAGAVVYSMVSDVVPPERRGKGMGLVMSSFPLASILGVPTGLWLVSLYDWEAPFLLLGGLSTLVLLLCLRFMPHTQTHKSDKNPFTQMKEILVHPTHQKGFLMSGALVFAGGCVIPFMATSMVANIGFTEAQLTWIYICGGVGALLSTRAIGAWADRASKVKVLAKVSFFACLSILAVTNLPPVSLPVALIVSTCFFIGMAGRFPPAMALITTQVEAQYRGGFMSVNSAVQQAANASASICAGWIIHRSATGRLEGYPWVGLISISCLGLTVFLASRLGAKTQTPEG